MSTSHVLGGESWSSVPPNNSRILRSCDLISKMSSVSGMQRGGVAVGDGGWNLSVFVTDLQVERTLRVRGDVHIGGLMIRLVDELGRETDGAAT